ncbi:hypothetical protein NDU88_002265 [Pleurodeles waltl]|uniref:Uncharacterized protein n=1 Tax=Pleurodeles waltl TaxID=8319 RepID=A0AAV7LC26_PLEWA|nr:hypothetical protein NDU88_002265 [Pleurodeles waltl]
MLPQSDPPYPEGIDIIATSNPEVQRVPTNPESRPGDGRQREPFCVVTRLEKGDVLDVGGSAVDWRTLICDDRKEDEDNEDGGGPLPTDSPAEYSTDDQTARTSGAGGTQRKLRPRLGKSVAPSGVWPPEARGREKQGEEGRKGI